MKITQYITNVLLSVLTAGVIGCFVMSIKIYNFVLLQPGIDRAQSTEITTLQADVKDIKNEQTELIKKTIIIEAMLPDKRQFEVTK